MFQLFQYSWWYKCCIVANKLNWLAIICNAIFVLNDKMNYDKDNQKKKKNLHREEQLIGQQKLSHIIWRNYVWTSKSHQISTNIQIYLQLKNNHDDISYCLPNYHLTITIYAYEIHCYER